MKFLIFLCFLIYTLTSGAQNKQLIYNVDELPQSLMTNPGTMINFDRHFGVPFLSHIAFSVGSTGASVHDIFDDASPDINRRVRNTIKRLTKNDFFTAQEQLAILSFGWRLNKDHYLSAGVYQELDVFAYFPKDPALLVVEGNSNYLNYPFDFSHVSFTGEVLTVYHIGLNKKIDNRLTVGGRIKLYSGIFNVESVDNTGLFITERTPGQTNYYRHYAENVDIRVNTSGFASLRDENSTVQQGLGDLYSSAFFGGNIGAGIDLGATYIIREDLIATGSVQDIGGVLQQSDVENYLYYGSYQTDGLEPLFPEVAPNGRTIPYWDIFEDEVDANLKDETLNEEYFTWRPFKVNASLEYGFGQVLAPCDYRRPTKRQFRNHIGLHAFAINRPRGLKMALTTFYDRKINNNLRMKVTYTLDKFSYTNVGMLVSTRFKNFNFYLAADNLFGYVNLAKTHSASFQMGFQFVINN